MERCLILWRIFNKSVHTTFNFCEGWFVWKTLTFGLLILVYASFSLAHGAYRDNLPQSTVEIHKVLLKSAKDSDWGKIKNYLSLLKALTATFQEKFGVNTEREILNALNQKEITALEKSLQRLVYLDIRDLLSITHTWENGIPNIEHIKIDMQTAYLNYLLLSPSVQEVNFSSDQKIKNLFRKVILSLIRTTPYESETTEYTAQKATIGVEVRQWITEIEEALLALWERT